MKINLRSKYLFGEVLFFTLFWMLIMHMYFMIAFWGHDNMPHDPKIRYFFEHYYGFWDIMFHSFTFGFFFSLINTYVDRSKYRRYSMGKIILIKTLLYLVAISIADTLLITLNAEFVDGGFSSSYMFLMRLVPTGFWMTTSFYYLFFILLINFLYQINKKIGPGILLNSILGKYHQPRDEKLIFLFLDLKNSTTIAEKLEHTKYSLFIKDCFSHLTNPIYNCDADVYQYIGDEAVLTWPLNKGLEDLNCIRLFFEFNQILEKNRDYYLQTYGVFPHFKVGADFGEVTVTEVGEMRRDLAFHGDVLNTAARLEKLCSKLGKQFLISEYLEAELPPLGNFTKTFVGEFTLDGKNHPIKVWELGE